MTQPFIKNIFFIFVVLFCFFFDMLTFSIMQKHALDLLFCLFITLLMHEEKKRYLVLPLGFLCLMSYLETNIFGWSLIYALPTIFLFKYFDQHLRAKWIIPYLLMNIAMFIKIIVNYYMLHIFIEPTTLLQILTLTNAVIALYMLIYKKFKS